MVFRRKYLFMGIVLVGLSNACADNVKEQKETKADSIAKEKSVEKAIPKTPDHRFSSKAQSTNTSKTVNVPKKDREIQFTPPRIVQDAHEYPPIVEQITESDWSSKTQSGTDVYYENVEPEMLPEIRNEENVLDFADEQAEFPGGMDAMRVYLKKNLMYPIMARDAGIQGKCYIRFIVNADGSISDVRVLRGVTDCPECDQEALRVVKRMPNWAPGKVNGKAVRINYNLPIVFKLT
jgi:protein TonB